MRTKKKQPDVLIDGRLKKIIQQAMKEKSGEEIINDIKKVCLKSSTPKCLKWYQIIYSNVYSSIIGFGAAIYFLIIYLKQRKV